MLNRLKNIINKRAFLLLWIGIALYTALFIYLSLKKYFGFSYNGMDLAIFNQVFTSWLQGDFLVSTLNLNTYLADHFTPIIFLLLPFYWLGQSPQVLLAMQTIVIALSAWPLYMIAKQVNNKITGLLVALLWLFNPLVHNANLFEFHLLPFAIFFVFWAFYFYRKNNFVGFAIFFVLALLVREDISLLLLGFVPIFWLDRKTLKWKLLSLIVPILYFLLALKIVSYFNPDGSYKFLVYYGWLGGTDALSIIWSYISHPIKLFWHVFSWQHLFGIAVMLLPVVFLPLLKPKYFWLALLPLCQFVFSGAGLSPVVYNIHYGLLFAPAIFIALIFALDKIQKKDKFKGSRILYQNYGFGQLALLAAIVYFAIFLSPVKNIVAKNYDSPVYNVEKEFVYSLSDQASVAAELKYLPQLSNRSNLYPMHYAYLGHGQFSKEEFDLPQVDYIIVDYQEFISNLTDIESSPIKQRYADSLPARWRGVLQEYSLTRAHRNFLVWQDKDKTFSELALYSSTPKTSQQGVGGFLLGYWMSDDNVLKLSFQKKHTEDNNYLVRFYTNNDSFDIPLDYGIYPEREWSENEIVTFNYYIDSEVKRFQIFSWTGENKIGPLREVAVDLSLRPISDQINL